MQPITIVLLCAAMFAVGMAVSAALIRLKMRKNCEQCKTRDRRREFEESLNVVNKAIKKARKDMGLDHE